MHISRISLYVFHMKNMTLVLTDKETGILFTVLGKLLAMQCVITKPVCCWNSESVCSKIHDNITVYDK